MQIISHDVLLNNLPRLKSLIGDFVRIESPSTEKPAVDRLGRRLMAELNGLGADIKIIPQAQVGDHFLARWGSGPGELLLLCHIDTVFDLGTLDKRPFHEEQGRLFGPGVLDMKGSSAMLIELLRLFRQETIWPSKPLAVLFTSDEETGSVSSRELIETEARQAEVVFCLEPALANGGLKTARKGTGEIELAVTGRSAHAGVDHAKGRNAIEELAHHVLAVQKLTITDQGTTVNVGLIQGGTRPNVVPGEARAVVDFRITTMAEYNRLVEWVKQITPIIDGTMVKADISLNRPPMTKDDTMKKTFEKAQCIGRATGLNLTDGSTGGASDANFVAPLGIPVLDGLGPVGDGAHSEREFVLVDSLVERSALLGALLLNW